MVRLKALFEFGRQTCLLADLVSRDPVEHPVTFDRNDLDIIGVDGMIAAFPEQSEPVCLQMVDKNHVA
jgi:hypothetical protein